MIEERCTCKHRRLLARYEPGAYSVDLLAPKAEIGMMLRVGPGEPGRGVPIEGSARCLRRTCKLLRRESTNEFLGR